MPPTAIIRTARDSLTEASVEAASPDAAGTARRALPARSCPAGDRRTDRRGRGHSSWPNSSSATGRPAARHWPIPRRPRARQHRNGCWCRATARAVQHPLRPPRRAGQRPGLHPAAPGQHHPGRRLHQPHQPGHPRGQGLLLQPVVGFSANRAGGSTLASVDVRNEVTGATLAELAKLYDSMASQPASAEELAGAKRWSAASTCAQPDPGRADRHAGGLLGGRPASRVSWAATCRSEQGDHRNRCRRWGANISPRRTRAS